MNCLWRHYTFDMTKRRKKATATQILGRSPSEPVPQTRRVLSDGTVIVGRETVHPRERQLIASAGSSVSRKGAARRTSSGASNRARPMPAPSPRQVRELSRPYVISSSAMPAPSPGQVRELMRMQVARCPMCQRSIPGRTMLIHLQRDHRIGYSAQRSRWILAPRRPGR